MSETEPAAAIESIGDLPKGHQMMAGTFVMYADGAGGLAIVAEVEGRGEQRTHVPKTFVDIFQGKGAAGRVLHKMMGPLLGGLGRGSK